MGSALLDNSAEAPPHAAPPGCLPGGGLPEPASVLRQEAAARLAAHRNRRAGRLADDAVMQPAVPRNARSARIAAAVAERYAQTPSYRDVLEAEAERAVQQARAAAEVAALKAEAIAAAQQSLLDALEAEPDIEPSAEFAEQTLTETAMADAHVETVCDAPLLWPELQKEERPGRGAARTFQPPSARAKSTRVRRVRTETAEADAPETGNAPGGAAQLPATPGSGITIRFYQDESGAMRIAFSPPAAPSVAPAAIAGSRWREGPLTEDEARLLEEEIAFRHEPVFEEPAGPTVPLPANLIEFPRQLVATRKARPRLAEGPLREEGAEDVPGSGQLRIFEVEPAQIATAREEDAAAAAVSAQWASIWLGSHPQTEQTRTDAAGEAGADSHPPSVRSARSLKDAASVQRRMLAVSVNAAVLAAAFSGFAAISLWLAGHLAALSMKAEVIEFLNRSTLQAALPFAVCAFALLAAIYQALFFSLSTATPGMRAARIALCTFKDENPPRAAIRRRLLALLLSSAPMGLGFLWAALDEERLTWHDRICGIYQRSY